MRHITSLPVNVGTASCHNEPGSACVLTKGGAGTQSGNLKWALYEANDESYTESEPSIAGGDFSNTSSPLTIKDGIAINSKETKYYVLKIWLNETGSAQNEDQGMTFSAKIRADME